VLHGALDSRTQPAHSLELGRRASSADKEVELVEGAQHQLLQDTGLVRAATTARVAAWVLAHA
jgi:alpha-beta hydrolase superfamily lysophospholipase